MTVSCVGIVGAGAVGLGSAAHLAGLGHRVLVWSPRRAPPGPAVRTRGAFEAAATIENVTRPEGLAGCATILTAVPATAYTDVLPRLAEVVRPGQHVIVGGALSLAPLWLYDILAARGVDALVSAWGTTLLTGRIANDGSVEVGTLRGTFPMAAVPAVRTGEAVARAEMIFARAFVPAASIIEITLSNINPVAHAGQVMANLSRIERGEAWQLFDCFTPAATRIADAIDAERCAVAAAFSLSVRTLADHYRASYHVDGLDVAEIVAAIHAAGRGTTGPSHLDHRYVLEDVPFGLAVIEAVARIARAPTPHTSAAITLLGAAYGRDFRADNPLLPRLVPPTTTAQELIARCG